jgi:uncharacterized protein (DUF1800 family)
MGHLHRHVWRTGGALVAILAAGAGGIRASSPLGPASAADTARAVHLLSRATYGVRPADVTALLATGEAAWLERQLHPERIDEAALLRRLERYTLVTRPPGELLVTFEIASRQARMAADSARMRGETPAPLSNAGNPRQILTELVTARLTRAVHAERQLEAVMTDFWFNHFNVFFGKGIARYLVADYEANAIRPLVFGRFEDMLRATARHPAMLFYLDNWTSAAPDSQPGPDRLTAQQRRRLQSGRLTPEQMQRLERVQQRGRERGINENYARELLELHTLGVDGGYTQDDVVAVARAFTGWTFRRPTARVSAGDIAFTFRPELHDRGEKRVLGRELPAGRGIEDGEDVLRLLAAHPSTARFLATRLVEHFVTDAPAPDLVDEIAAVYLRTTGDLRQVTRALFTSERFYDGAVRRAKVKTPFELVASAFRVLDVEVAPSRRTIEALRALGQLPYGEPAPTGFPAMSEDWVNSGALLARMNFALDLAAGRIDGVRPVRPAATAPTGPGGVTLDATLASLLPGVPTADLADRIRADLDAQQDLAPRARAARTLGLALGSPEFQRR